MLILPPFRPFMAMLNPCPSSPSRLATGTAQSSNITARVGWEFQPTWRTEGHASRQDRELLLPSSGRARKLVLVKTKNTRHLFFFFAKVETRRSLLHHQTGDALRPFGSRSAHHDVDVCVSPSADEGLREDRGQKKQQAHTELPAHCEGHLGAVQDVVVAFPLRRGQKRSRITAAACNPKKIYEKD